VCTMTKCTWMHVVQRQPPWMRREAPGPSPRGRTPSRNRTCGGIGAVNQPAGGGGGSAPLVGVEGGGGERVRAPVRVAHLQQPPGLNGPKKWRRNSLLIDVGHVAMSTRHALCCFLSSSVSAVLIFLALRAMRARTAPRNASFQANLYLSMCLSARRP
jgi:hypothetical protein